MIYLDTHVVAWLYAGRIDLFPEQAIARLEAGPLRISPLVTLELEYLHELGRLLANGRDVVMQLMGQIGLEICDLPLAAVVNESLAQTWTRDPFDRLIVGHAIAGSGTLLSKDQTIRRHCAAAAWD